MAYRLLFDAFDLVQRWLGLPLALLAWLTVAGGAAGMTLVLRRAGMRGRWMPSLAVGALALAGHSADIFVTLKVSPDLSLEGNPMWLSIVDAFGLPFALFYGLSGQFLVCVLSVQLFAWYLASRETMWPARAATFGEFVRGFGAASPKRWGVRWRSLGNFFAFLFSLIGPYFFYVAWLNSMVTDEARYLRWPSPVATIAVYLVALSALYFVVGWWSWRRRAPVAAATAA